MAGNADRKEARKKEAQKHLGLVKGLFATETARTVEGAVLYEDGEGRDLPIPEPRFESTAVSVEWADGASVASKAKGKVCLLDPASYTKPGGNYLGGGWSPEEQLCAESNLFCVLEGLKDIPTLKPLHMRVECEDRILEDDYIFCAVTNSISVGGILKLDPDKVRLNDGLFEVMLIRYPTQPIQLTKIINALRLGELPSEMIEFFTADKLRITTQMEREWTLDGERGEAATEFEIINQYKKVQLVLPAKSADTIPVVSETLPAVTDEINICITKDDAED